MGFRLFGVNVEIQIGFWISAVLLGWGGGSIDLPRLLLWIPVVFLSILVHEYGHALAIMRHGIEPEITLHFMGGKTTWREVLPISRGHRIIISLAGPFAGFILGGLVFAFMRLFPAAFYRLPDPARLALSLLVFVNVFWGIFNLLPVLPLDGGHVLAHALGPKRARLAALISLIFAVGGAALFLVYKLWLAAYIFAVSAFQSYQRLQGDAPVEELTQQRRPPPERHAAVPGEIGAKLRAARHALANDETARAASLASEAVRMAGESETPLPRVKVEAYEILGWAAHMRGDMQEAARWVKAAEQHGAPDAALVAAVLLGLGDAKEARKLLEAARAAGDDRKEIVGPLIQILIGAGEVARAAAIAFDIVESLSDDDARKMAQIAFEGRAFDWAARLSEAVFTRTGAADDAYEAARAHTADGAHDKGLELLARAVAAGFSDRARAWSDAALEPLRAGQKLEAIVPRP